MGIDESKQSFTSYIVFRFFDTFRLATVWSWFPVLSVTLLLNAQLVSKVFKVNPDKWKVIRTARSKLSFLLEMGYSMDLENPTVSDQKPPRTEDLLYSRDCLFDRKAGTGKDGLLVTYRMEANPKLQHVLLAMEAGKPVADSASGENGVQEADVQLYDGTNLLKKHHQSMNFTQVVLGCIKIKFSEKRFFSFQD